LVKIYTKRGDKGKSDTLKRERLHKSDSVFDVCGSIDECNAHVGVLLGYIKQDQSELYLLERDIEKVQRHLFQLGVEVSGKRESKSEHFIKESDITFLEIRIDWLTDRTPPLEHFILPGGAPAGAYAHVCRAYIRRLERKLVKWSLEHKVDLKGALSYINRLGDYFFALGRFINAELKQSETAWP
jgi:cob(I)alamin adenosyltransferase